MKKIIFSLLLSLFFVPFVSLSAKALTLDYIGNLSTSGSSYSHWYYTGLKPRLGGTSQASNQISLSVGSQTGSVSADSSGNWYWDPSENFTAGDHAVSINDGTDTLAFTLTLGSSGSGSTSSATASGVPATGWTLPTILVISILLIATSFGYLRLVKREA